MFVNNGENLKKILLNKEQQEAVKATGSSMLIVAGAGTGKTRVLVEKLLYLLDQGIDPAHLLALTFTNKAGDEMRDRVVGKVKNGRLPFIGTFHSFCVLLLREFGDKVGIKKNFIIFDSDALKKLVRQCMKNLNIQDFRPTVVAKKIDHLKIMQVLEKDSPKGGVWTIAKEVLPKYSASLAQENALDFNDLLIYGVRLLKNNGTIRTLVQSRYQYILVDEFQDTDALQNMLIELLKGKHSHVVVVGDTDQTIYSWRGADVRNLLEFPQKYDSDIIFLKKNYRSTKTILDAANAIICKNVFRQEKNLEATRSKGDCIKLMCANDEDEEAALIAETIINLHTKGVAYSDIAILFRVNFQARALEMQLLRYDIPYTVLGARFFDRQEIKNLVAYLTLVYNPRSRSAYERASSVPRRGIGKQTLKCVFDGAFDSLSPLQQKRVIAFESDIKKIQTFVATHTIEEVLLELVRLLNYKEYLQKNFDNPEERMLQVRELIAFSKRFSGESGRGGILDFLSEVSLGSDQDTLRTNTKKNSVRLMTIHAAKGLEFPYVFVSGMEEGVFPLYHENDEDAEEERRLCYVAFTRAKDLLYCSFAKRRGIFGSYKNMLPSSFLKDIPEHLTAQVKPLLKTSHSSQSFTKKALEDIEW